MPTVYFDIDSVAVCQGEDAIVPISSWYFDQIDSMHLSIHYDGSALQYNGYAQVHPGLTNFNLTHTLGNPNQITMTANSINSMSFRQMTPW